MSKDPIIWAARIPAFLAPSKATVATGTPPGICKIDRTESQPSMEFLDFTGTPITGKGDKEATIPGKCAAPPAPAIITLIPLSWAVLLYSNNFSGVLCADTISTSVSSTPLGPIGVSISGVPFYNQYAGPNNQPLDNEIPSFDNYYGHPQQTGQYHYHWEPTYLTFNVIDFNQYYQI